MKPDFDIELLPEAIEFLENLDDKAREKIYYNIKKSQFVNDNDLFKKLNNFIWEHEVSAKLISDTVQQQSVQTFSFWDKTDGNETLVIATHGILKKAQKTPPKEIKKAEEIRKQYLDNKLKKK